MSIGLSILLIAAGAVLRYAVSPEWEDVNEDTLGLILMWVGGIGLAVSLIFGMLVTNTTRRVFKSVDVRNEDDDDVEVRRPRRYRDR